MNYYTLLVVNSNFDVNEGVLGKIQRTGFAGNTASKVDSSIIGLENQQLSIHTEMAFLAVSSKTEEIAHCRYLTKFYFPKLEIIQNGTTPEAVRCVKECIDLAQSHAYGLFCHFAKKKNVPIQSIQLQPMEKMETVIFDFLNGVKHG
ncbi:hypothetical protein [Dyadobacter diqingensis]|uniref:hypothetical protein n=1 Tax=Dyadobacter diqingensis TaxID=2938121 RepID=UPI0020C24B14|nr:hypothetical protein [Dyadobacter diqingensis]